MGSDFTSAMSSQPNDGTKRKKSEKHGSKLFENDFTKSIDSNISNRFKVVNEEEPKKKSNKSDKIDNAKLKSRNKKGLL